MKSFILKITLLIIAVLQFSCNASLKGEGELTEKTIPLEEPITELTLKGNYQAVLIKDSIQKVVIEAQANLVENLSSNIKNGHLLIEENKSVSTDDMYKVYIYYASINEIKLHDNIDLDVSGEIRTDVLKLNLKGNSKFISNVFTKEIDLKMEGNSQLNLSGNTADFSAELSGNSQMIAPLFIVNEANIDLKGNAEAQMQIIKNLDGKAKGNSTLQYIGNPEKDFQTQDQSKLEKTEAQ